MTDSIIYTLVQIVRTEMLRIPCRYENPDWRWWTFWRRRFLPGITYGGTRAVLSGEGPLPGGLYTGRMLTMLKSGTTVLIEDSDANSILVPFLSETGDAVIT